MKHLVLFSALSLTTHAFGAPVWNEPIEFATKVGSTLVVNLNQPVYVTSSTASAMTFSVLSGPRWISIAADGQLSGTPERADQGNNTFVVRACESDGTCAEANVVFDVKP